MWTCNVASFLRASRSSISATCWLDRVAGKASSSLPHTRSTRLMGLRQGHAKIFHGQPRCVLAFIPSVLLLCGISHSKSAAGRCQVQWIGGALQAANSTLGHAARPGALLPVPTADKDWPDYHAGDPGFATAAALAVVGAVTPRPGPQPFHPQQPISTADLQLWAHSAASLLPSSLATQSRARGRRSSDENVSGDSDRGRLVLATRSQAASIIVSVLLGGSLGY